MFFHIRIPGIMVLHELGGLILIILALLHLILNWRAMISCCQHKSGRIAIFVGVSIIVILLVLGIAHDDHHRQRNGNQKSRIQPSLQLAD